MKEINRWLPDTGYIYKKLTRLDNRLRCSNCRIDGIKEHYVYGTLKFNVPIELTTQVKIKVA